MAENQLEQLDIHQQELVREMAWEEKIDLGHFVESTQVVSQVKNQRGVDVRRQVQSALDQFRRSVRNEKEVESDALED